MSLIDSYTKLLLHMDGDQSASGHDDIEYMDGMKTNANQVKFGKHSIYFDGTTCIKMADSSDWDFGFNPFTIDLWVYPKSSPDGNEGLISNAYGIGHAGGWMLNLKPDNTVQFFVDTNNTPNPYMTAPGVTRDAWNHIAVVRTSTSAGALKIYINGVEKASMSGNYNINSLTSYPTYIGKEYHSGNPSNYYLDGYMDEIRISKGIARWSDEFDVPTERYTSDSYTKLLLRPQGDFTFSPHELTFKGSPKLVSSGKFGGSIYFDGSTDYLSIPDSDDWNFGSEDFTIDCWVWTADSVGGIVGNPTFNTDGWMFEIYTGGNLAFFYNGWETRVEGTAVVSDGAWHHLAVVRNGISLKLYVDGTEDASGTINTSITHNSNLLVIGDHGNEWDAHYYFSGYMDELRISKGIARWTENFTPPGAAYRWPIIGGTLAEDATIMVINEDDDSIEYAQATSAGNYEIEITTSGTKSVVARNTDGEVVGFGKITPQ